MKTWLQSAGVYSNPRVLAFLFLGFSSGLPFGVVAEPMTAWLAESGVTKTAIGLFALVSLPYSLKFIWAPLMDHLPLPVMTRVFGRRRGWALVTQVLLLGAVLGLGMTDPATDLWWTAAFAFVVTFASASQDIVIDAYRVESLDAEQLAAGAATATFGWRLGQVGAGAAGLIMADMFPWVWVYTGMAALVLVGIVAILLNPEPKTDAPEPDRDLAAWMQDAVVGPFKDFVIRPGWIAIVLFVLLYKFGDAVLSVMKIPFFLEIGFTKTEIAEIAKVFGFNAIIAGGFLGGLVLARTGILTGLMICGVLMAASNLVFVVQAWAGADLLWLTATIAVENITTGMGTTAFVAYLSSLCHSAYTATQYALLTSLMAFSRTVMSSGAGWLAERVDWVTFFILTTIAAVPGLLVLAWLMRQSASEKRLAMSVAND
ncbi:MAG: AmpG family muropeptide MFS transporter [Rhodospirillaceae bacterium]|jgi:MFS transporter, PAT family, beta-lactamase induction signal transducer AmpG|nr:AmpG family muropeptide MFS transporter [Rhodospirillaceae bacterium]